MKKTLSILVAAATAVLFSACSSDEGLSSTSVNAETVHRQCQCLVGLDA